MSPLISIVTGGIALLFVAVGALLLYGARAFQRPIDTIPSDTAYAGRSIDMRREVLWTALAAGLLLVIFFAIVWWGAA